MTHAQTIERGFTITRTFDAPREIVFQAFVDPDQAAAWWAPECFEAPRASVNIEPRVGGRYDLVMVESGSGTEYPVRQEITELVDPELLVLRSEAMPEFGLEATTTRIELHDEGGSTRLTVTGGPYSDEMRGNAETGWSQQLDKLARLLGGAA